MKNGDCPYFRVFESVECNRKVRERIREEEDPANYEYDVPIYDNVQDMDEESQKMKVRKIR